MPPITIKAKEHLPRKLMAQVYCQISIFFGFVAGAFLFAALGGLFWPHHDELPSFVPAAAALFSVLLLLLLAAYQLRPVKSSSELSKSPFVLALGLLLAPIAPLQMSTHTDNALLIMGVGSFPLIFSVLAIFSIGLLRTDISIQDIEHLSRGAIAPILSHHPEFYSFTFRANLSWHEPNLTTLTVTSGTWVQSVHIDWQGLEHWLHVVHVSNMENKFNTYEWTITPTAHQKMRWLQT